MMNIATREHIWLSIQNLSPESLAELVNFIDYLHYKNKPQQQDEETNFMTSQESDLIIQEILTEMGGNISSLSDYAVSRAGIYEEHP